MAFSRTLFVFLVILQIVQCHNFGDSEKLVTENKTGVQHLSSQKLHVFAEKFKPFLYETDNNQSYIGINYFLIKTIGEHLNMGISLELATNENRLENWRPSLKCANIDFSIQI